MLTKTVYVTYVICLANNSLDKYKFILMANSFFLSATKEESDSKLRDEIQGSLFLITNG